MYFARMGDPSKLSQGLLKNPWASEEWSSKVMIWSTPATANMFATTKDSSNYKIKHQKVMKGDPRITIHFAEIAARAFFFFDCLL